MEIKNIPALRYCLQKSSDNVQKTFEEKGKGIYRDEDNYEIYFQIGTTLFWIISCYDRLEPSGAFSPEEKYFFSALKCANNAQKHNASLFRLDKIKGGLSFPWVIPEEGFEFLPIEPFWNSLDNVKNIRIPEQKEAYQKILKGHPIKPDLDKAVQILLKHLHE